MQLRVVEILQMTPPLSGAIQAELNSINLALPCVTPLVATLDQVIYYSDFNS